MVNEILEKFLDFDEQTKDEAWAAEMVRLVMRDAKAVISKEEYDKLKNVLYGEFDEGKIDKVFASPTMQRYKQKMSTSTVFFFERIRNSLIDDRNQSGLTITVNSLDPEKEDKRNQDKELLKNRKGIEGLLNEITANNGMPPKKIEGDDFEGNVDEFDKMGSDEFDPTDVDNFFTAVWGLKAELYLQNPLNAVFRANQVRGYYDKYINDILICLHVFSQVWVDDIEGGIKIDHLYPYEVEVLQATGSNNYKDAQGFNVKRSTNVRGFMKRFGSYFNFDRDWQLLITASHGGSIQTYTGLCEKGSLVYGYYGELLEFDRLLDMPISYSYTEWKTMNRNTSQKAVTKEGNIINQKVDKETPRVDGASLTEKYSEETYYAFSFDINGGVQHPKLAKWGKVYMQEFEGLEDEYSGFTIKGNKRDGVAMATILKPFHQIIQIAFKMLEMLINDIKPDGLIMNYTSIMKVAEYLKTAKNVPNDTRTSIDHFFQMVEESPNLLADTPTTEEGEPLGGGNLGVQTKKNGLNKAANDLISIIDWCEQKSERYLGTAGLENLEARDGYKLSIENKKRTRLATSFIDFILLAHLEDISITTLNYVQDISKFKTIPAYKYLEAQVGKKVMTFIGEMKKTPHRNGVYLDTFNNDIELMEIRAVAQEARATGEISLEQYMVLRSIENPKQATYYLAYERKKTQKQKQTDAMSMMQQQDAMAEKAYQRQKALDDNKGEWTRKANAEQALGFTTAAQINAKSAIERERMSQEGLNARATEKALNEIDKIAEVATQNAQKPLI